MKASHSLYFALCCALLLQSARAQPVISPDYFSVLRSGDSRALHTLLDHGASPNARDAEGNTPLMLATVYGNAVCVKLLLEHGAAVNVTNAQGATPLMRAAHDYDKLRLIVDAGANVNVRSALGNTALILAARPSNSRRSVNLLLGHGADARATNNWGANALMAAAAGGDAESARMLIEQGADPNAMPIAEHAAFVFNGGRSALMWAAFRGDIAMIKTLLAAGADINGEGLLGTPLEQTTWNDQADACQYLLEHGADVKQVSDFDSYTALHWAASSENPDPRIVKMLLASGADPNLGGGDSVDAFMGVEQTPLMLAKRRGPTPILVALVAAGATNETPDDAMDSVPPTHTLPRTLDKEALHSAAEKALPLLQNSSIQSKRTFVEHASHQDCLSCHQQYLPLAAISLARKQQIAVDVEQEKQLREMVRQGDLKNPEFDWEALFHPDPAYSRGYALFGFDAADMSAAEPTDAWVHHLAVIQEEDGHWAGNLPRPPLQSGDIGATALTIHALQRYALPGRRAEFVERVARARKWLRRAKATSTDSQVYQILGLSWSGEPIREIQPFAKILLAEQREDGGWAQLPTLKSDAYATGQSIYALCAGAGIPVTHPAIRRARKYLLATQLEDGSWHVHRRAFPFQPTMKSGFPHGRDSWISAAATSWAVIALSLPEPGQMVKNP